MFSMNGVWAKDSLLGLRESETFLCPSCKKTVLLRIGNHRIPHFAHVKKSDCDSFSEGESAYHLEGKVQLYEWLTHQGYSPELEPYFKKVKQRPDLFVCNQKYQYTIEFQCSALDSNRFKERTENYILNGFSPLWILGGKRLKQTSNNRFTLSTFDWMFTKLINKKPSLLYYCPEIKKFLILHEIVPLTSSTVIATLDIISPHERSLTSLQNQVSNMVYPIDAWLDMKKSWRLNCTQFPSHSMKKLLNFLYLKQIYPSLIPSEVGIPVPSMYWIQTSPMIWQSWILLEYIETLPTYSQFSFQSVYHFIKMKKKSQLFFVKELPLITNSHYSFAIMEYLDRLVDTGLLMYIDKKTFQKMRNCQFPSQIEEALLEDQRLLLMLKEKKREM